MAVKVADASILAALLFGEPGGEGIVARLGDARLVAPNLLSFELANACFANSRRHPAQAAALATAFALRRRLAVEESEVDHDDAVALAARTGLTAYDVSYLWLARQLQAELVTLDAKLGRVATAS